MFALKKHIAVLAFSTAALSACAASSPFPQQVVDYACNDVVVIGRVETISQTTVASADNLVGNVRYDARVQIRKVLFGEEERSMVGAQGVAHVPLRDDLDFILVLSPRGQEYEIVNAVLPDVKPKPTLREACISS